MPGKDFVVIHHSLTKDSGTVSWGAIRRYHVEVNKWRDIGYHYGIEEVADSQSAGRHEILVGRQEWETAAAVKEQNMNERGIHVCLVGNFDDAPPPKAMWDLLVKLVASICYRWKIQSENVRAHSDYNPKSCPGKSFPMQRLRIEVSAAMKRIT